MSIPWWRQDPAPSWVPRLGMFISAMGIGFILGYGFGLMH